MNDAKNVDGGDALFAVAAEITGETALIRAALDVPNPIDMRTNKTVANLVAGINSCFDARFAAKFEAALRHWLPIVGGPLTVRGDVAPVVREIRGDVGDRFERVGESCTGCMFEVQEIWESGTRSMSGDGHHWRADIGMLRDPSLFRFISSAAERAAAKVAIAAAGEAPAEMSVQSPYEDDAHGVKVGDRFRRMSGSCAGEVYTVDRFDNDGDAWGNLCDTRRCIAVDELLDDSMWTRVVAPEEVVSDDGSDPDLPVGNLRTAAETLIETDTAIADLIRVWHAYQHQRAAGIGVQNVVEVLAKCAGLPVPWMRPE